MAKTKGKELDDFWQKQCSESHERECPEGCVREYKNSCGGVSSTEEIGNKTIEERVTKLEEIVHGLQQEN